MKKAIVTIEVDLTKWDLKPDVTGGDISREIRSQLNEAKLRDQISGRIESIIITK